MRVVFAGKTSTSLEIASGPPSVPPVIMRPARGGLYIYTRQVQNFCTISTAQTLPGKGRDGGGGRGP